MAKTFCTRCKKLFDYDLYSGLCPNCGCFHQSPGISNNNTDHDSDSMEAELLKHLNEDKEKGISHNDHKTGTADPHIDQMKRDVEKMKQTTYEDIKKNTKVKSVDSTEINLNGKNINGVNKLLFIVPLLIIIVIAIISSVYSFVKNKEITSIGEYVDELFNAEDDSDSDSNIEYFDDSVDMEELTEDPDDLEPETDIYGGDNSYYVNCAWEMADYEDISDYTDEITLPEGKCLIALDMEMYYDGEDPKDPAKYYMPIVYDGTEYCAPLDKDQVAEIADAYSIKEFSLDPEKIYSNPESDDEDYNDGFLYYIIDDACAYITVCLEFRENGELFRTGYMEVPVEDIDSAYGDYDDTLDWDDFEEVPEE